MSERPPDDPLQEKLPTQSKINDRESPENENRKQPSPPTPGRAPENNIEELERLKTGILDSKPERVPFSHETVVNRSILKVTIGANTSAQNTFAGTVNQFAAPTSEVMFSPELASPISDAAECELRALVTLDPDFSKRLISSLDKQRVVLITGAPQSGKGTIAKYLATEIATRQRLPNETYVVGPLESRVRVLPRELASDCRLSGRVTIFEDAFAYGNKDLFTFFRSDSVAWEELRASLTANDAFFVFTTSHSQLETLRDRLRLACFEVSTSMDLLTVALERKVTWIESSLEVQKEKVAELRDKCERIVARLPTIPRVSAMIDDFLAGDKPLELVLERHASATPSLLDDLCADADAWCFALTLAITETSDEPLPWSEFDRLRRLLMKRIKSERELFPRMRPRDSDPTSVEDRSAAAWFSDRLLLTRCQATFRKDASGLRDVVAFTDPACGRRIRKSLVDHHHRLLLLLAPLLREIAESSQRALSLRTAAAYTLGRIGTIDPQAISLPLLESDWARHEQTTLRLLVGPVVRGALSDDNERYGEAALSALSRLAHKADEQPDEAALTGLRTAIGAYSELGNYTAAKAMIRLGEIAAQHCVPAIETAYEHFMAVESSNREQLVARSQNEATAAAERGEHHLEAAILAKVRCDVIAEPLVHAIARLCHEDIRALTAIRDWLSAGGTGMRLLVPYLFLVEHGIADRLEQFAVSIDVSDSLRPINAVIFAAAASRQSQHDLAAFLCDIYANIARSSTIPDAVQEELEEQLAACLIRWAESAAPAPQFRHGMEELFGTLATARGSFMRRWLFTLVRRPEFAKTEELKAFSSAARRQMDV